MLTLSWEQIVTIATISFFSGTYVGTVLIMWSELKHVRKTLESLSAEMQNVPNVKATIKAELATFENSFLQKLNGTYVRTELIKEQELRANFVHENLQKQIDVLAQVSGHKKQKGAEI